jgi:hypothetical protein
LSNKGISKYLLEKRGFLVTIDDGSPGKSCSQTAVILKGIIGKENDDGENGSK